MAVFVIHDGEDVRVVVSGPVPVLGPVPLDVDVSAEAVARLEPGVRGTGGGGG
jgi:hypothetical protein